MSNDGEGEGRRLEVDTAVYPLEAVQAAAYAFTDRAYVRVERAEGSAAAVTLKAKRGPDGLAVLEGEFYNELLHQALRLKISQNNQRIREYIVTKALVSAQTPQADPPAAEAQRPDCPDCAPAASAPMDAELEKEIEKLMIEIEKSGGKEADPLGVTVPWEKKFGAKGRKQPPS